MAYQSNINANDLFEQLLSSGLEGLLQLLSTMINEAMKHGFFMNIKEAFPKYLCPSIYKSIAYFKNKINKLY